MIHFVAKDPDYAQRVRASFARQGAMTLIGAQMTELAPGYCAISVVPRPEILQQHGYVHAGIVATLVDSAGGFAGFTLFPADSSVLTVEFKLNLLAPADRRPAGRGRLRGQAGPHARDHARRGARGKGREAYAGGPDAADADRDARQAGSVAKRGLDDAQLSRPRLQPRRDDRHAARDGAAVRRRRDRAARRGHRSRQSVSRRPVAKDGRPGTARHHRRGGVRRHGHGLPRARRGDGGDFARVGGGGAVLRRAFEPVRQPDPAQRQRGAEAALPAEAHQRRARRRAGDERTGIGIGRRVDAPARGPAGQRARPSAIVLNGNKMWITNGPEADTLVVYAKTDVAGRTQGHHRVPDREGHEGIHHRAEARQARHARLEHLRARVPGLRSARPRTSWARKGAA